MPTTPFARSVVIECSVSANNAGSAPRSSCSSSSRQVEAMLRCRGCCCRAVRVDTSEHCHCASKIIVPRHPQVAQLRPPTPTTRRWQLR